MKPKYDMKLGELIRYYHLDHSTYTLNVYVNDKLAYNGSVQCAYEFGHDYLMITEYFRNADTKTIAVYTEDLI